MDKKNRKKEYTIPKKDFNNLKRFYEKGLYLHAYDTLQNLPDITEWTGIEERILAAKLALVLGNNHAGSVLMHRTWKLHPQSPDCIYYYTLSILSRRGPYLAMKMLEKNERYIDLSEKSNTMWYALKAHIASDFRDFSTAYENIGKALTLDKDDPWLYTEQAKILTTDDKHNEALRSVEKALALREWYAPAVMFKAHLLQLNSRFDDATQFLLEAKNNLEYYAVPYELLKLRLERQDFQTGFEYLDDIIKLTPMRDNDIDELLVFLQTELYYGTGDYAKSIMYARQLNNSFYHTLADNITKNENAADRKCLIHVDFIRQYHLTCGPATISMLTKYFGNHVKQESIIQSIWYSGTYDYDERQWALDNNWYVKEFTVTWESLIGLLDKKIPFAVATVRPEGGHLQAIVGYDKMRETIFLRDPYYYNTNVMLQKDFFDVYRSSGPRGMIIVPIHLKNEIENINLPDEEMYQLSFSIQKSLKEHDREQALFFLNKMEKEAPDHPMVIKAKRTLASYDHDEVNMLMMTDLLLKKYPDDLMLLLSKQLSLSKLGKKSQRIELLKNALTIHKNNPGLLLEYVSLIFDDARNRKKVLSILNRVLLQSPVNDYAFFQMGTVLWNNREYTQALEWYRLAASIDSFNEFYALHYFRTARSINREEQALTWLKKRFDFYVRHSSSPAVTLFKAYDMLDRTPEGFSVLEKALEARSDDSDLCLFMVRTKLNNGYFEEAEQLLYKVQGKVHNVNWLAAKAELEYRKGNLEISCNDWEKVIKLDPFNYQAHNEIVSLLFRLKGKSEALAHIDSFVKKFPHNTEFYELYLQWVPDNDYQKRGRILQQLLDLVPDNAWAIRELAGNLMMQSKFHAAEDQLNVARELDPGTEFLYNLEGDLAEMRGDHVKARNAYRKAIEMSVDDIYAINKLLMLARSNENKRTELLFIKDQIVSQITNGDSILEFRTAAKHILSSQELLDVVEDGRKKRPDLWQMWAAESMQMMDMGMNEKALAVALQAVEKFPLIPRLMFNCALIYQCNEDFENEQVWLKKALEVNPEWDVAIKHLSENLERLDCLEDARNLLIRSLQRDPLESTYYGYLAELEWRSNQKDRAFEYIEKAIDINPEYHWAWDRLHEWSQELNRPEIPVNAAHELVDKQPGNAYAWLVLARMLDVDKQIEVLDKVIELDPGMIIAHEMKIEALVRMGKYPEAMEAVDYPGWRGEVPLVLQGYIPWIYKNRGLYHEAITRLNRLLKKEPLYADGWNMLSQLYEEKGDFEQSLKTAQKFVELEPNNEYALVRVAEMLIKKDETKEAGTLFKKAFYLNPAYGYAGTRLFDLQFVSNDTEDARHTLYMLEKYATPELVPYIIYRKILLSELDNDKEACLDLFKSLTHNSESSFWLLEKSSEIIVRTGLTAEYGTFLEECYLNSNAVNENIGSLWTRRYYDSGDTWIKEDQLIHLLQAGNFGRNAISEYFTLIMKSDNFEFCLDVIDTFRDNFKSDDQIWGFIGYVLIESGNMDEVIDWHKDWKTRKGVKPWMLSNLASAYRYKKRDNDALDVVKAAISKEPDYSTNLHYIWYALSLIFDQDIQTGREIYEQIDISELCKYDQFIYKMLDALIGFYSYNSNQTSHACKYFTMALKNARKFYYNFYEDSVLLSVYNKTLSLVLNAIKNNKISIFWRLRLSFLFLSRFISK